MFLTNRLAGKQMNVKKNDYEMTVLILQFSAILTEILMVLKIHVNA